MSEYITVNGPSLLMGRIEVLEATNEDDAWGFAKSVNRYVESLDLINEKLRQQIADLQAENAKLKADCASYNKVLNDVAIGYLEATEKLKEVEAKESPTVIKSIDNDVQLATPKYKVGQFVKLENEFEGEWIGKINSIRRIEEDNVIYGIAIAGWEEQPFDEDEIDFETSIYEPRN